MTTKISYNSFNTKCSKFKRWRTRVEDTLFKDTTKRNNRYEGNEENNNYNMSEHGQGYSDVFIITDKSEDESARRRSRVILFFKNKNK